MQYHIGVVLVGLVVAALLTEGLEDRFSIRVGESGHLDQSSEFRVINDAVNPEISFIGDSLAGQFGLALSNRGLGFDLQYKVSCPFWARSDSPRSDACVHFWIRALDSAVQRSPHKLVIASYFEDLRVVDIENLGNALMAIEKKLRSANITSIKWIIQTSTIDYSCELRRYHFFSGARPRICINSGFRDQILLKHMSRYFPNVDLLSPVKFFCDDWITCSFILGEQAVFNDNVHLSLKGSSTLLNHIVDEE